MSFIFIVGTRFFSWGSERAGVGMRCPQCGTAGNFVSKKGMRFITLFFIIPLIPISGVKQLLQCANCGTRFDAAQ
ncbi:MAG TPA: zinc-ribbon domain-containing protein [Pyrinomonadaceae bacterium]|jgi:DNA-directed RNA polymerase subunit RPC12/RpoP|nr:zinc-ribbon domain-containing protein [Pyrinomonadaceae bacterium]